MPWAYELAYMALLFHTGLLGFLAYSAGVALDCVDGTMHDTIWPQNRAYILPVLVGMVCFLIANATNPYLEKYDIYGIFLPVSIDKSWLLTHRAKIHSFVSKGVREPVDRLKLFGCTFSPAILGKA